MSRTGKSAIKTRCALKGAPESAEVEHATREKCRKAIQTALIPNEDEKLEADHQLSSDQLAAEIEETIYRQGCNVGLKYKTSMRSHLMTLKDKTNPLRADILCGQVSGSRFALMTVPEMTSQSMKEKDEKLKEYGMQMAIKESTSEQSILDIKMRDGRERGKWGVSSSAAAVDYFEHSSYE
ncbi:transcription factor S-II, central domain-containing protein [Lipomyces oligophaga]|uniref:transcription factor S-II, central domain-containing protein n=1 Tax=Lipomyces oligophaga TaxID=45792 RepID=UPI0034CE2291